MEIRKIADKVNPDTIHFHSSKAGYIEQIAAKRTCTTISFSEEEHEETLKLTKCFIC